MNGLKSGLRIKIENTSQFYSNKLATLEYWVEHSELPLSRVRTVCTVDSKVK